VSKTEHVCTEIPFFWEVPHIVFLNPFLGSRKTHIRPLRSTAETYYG
jgi:hypothetical protein